MQQPVHRNSSANMEVLSFFSLYSRKEIRWPRMKIPAIGGIPRRSRSSLGAVDRLEQLLGREPRDESFGGKNQRTRPWPSTRNVVGALVSLPSGPAPEWMTSSALADVLIRVRDHDEVRKLGLSAVRGCEIVVRDHDHTNLLFGKLPLGAPRAHLARPCRTVTSGHDKRRARSTCRARALRL